jgi:hypothetical protein
MRKSWLTEEQIAHALRQVEAGVPIAELCRKMGISETTFHACSYELQALEVRTKKRRKRASHLRVIPPPPAGPNEPWSMDFMRKTIEGGRPFRASESGGAGNRNCWGTVA